ncbi:MAG: methyltransferase domain-containing protein [bacterium]|nr:methyltransferase domain-containing protein [bacterium]
MDIDKHKNDIRNSYGKTAKKYAELYYNELEKKPFDRDILDRFADRVRDHGPLCDMGCGPGQIARYLKDMGVDSFGIDLSPETIETARKLNPDIEFNIGDMMALDADDNSWAGIAAFYSIIHIPGDKITDTFRELYRVLKINGILLLSFHLGSKTMLIEELWDEEVCFEFYFFEKAEIERSVKDAGFIIEESHVRDPYKDVEYESRRCYILAVKPDNK